MHPGSSHTTLFHRLSARIANMLGVDESTRNDVVTGLFGSTEHRPAVYWLQLLVATGIAHLGLVLDSTAVIIGAMLVSPLMTPIVQVGMGFTLGNLYLTLRSSRHLLASILVVALFAAGMTVLMPFQELTREIVARTQPTFLDLIVALFCGIAAAFTTSRETSGSTTAAAGTAIAIALVPPVCVVGYGIGIGEWTVASGAMLLFIANLAAIVLVSNLFFLLTGFGEVDIEWVELAVFDDEVRRSRLYLLAKSLRLPVRYSRWRVFRLFLPLAFVATVALPLSTALQQVVWQVRVRAGIARLISDLEVEHTVIRQRLDVTRSHLSLRLTVVGEPRHGPALQRDLALKIAALSGEEPNVRVDVMPSQDFLQRRLDRSTELIDEKLSALRQAEPEPACPPAPDLAQIRREAIFDAKLSQLTENVQMRFGLAFVWALPELEEWSLLGFEIKLNPERIVVQIGYLGHTEPPAVVRRLIRSVLEGREVGLGEWGFEFIGPPPVLVDVDPDQPVDLAALDAGLRSLASTPGQDKLVVHLEQPALAEDEAAGPGAAAVRDRLIAALGEERVIKSSGPRLRAVLTKKHDTRVPPSEPTQTAPTPGPTTPAEDEAPKPE